MTNYPPAIERLLVEERLPALGPGEPNAAAYPLLKSLTVATAFAPLTVIDGDMAQACLAGLWLFHDFLDESHNISQDLGTPEGSYWHALMHRREPDFWNSKYWSGRVGRHAVFEPLRAAAAKMANESMPDLPLPAKWDPLWFVDFCEACSTGRQPGEVLARRLQQTEWQLLFDYCLQRAART